MLLSQDPADPVAADIVQASDHEKQTIDRIEFWFTVSGDRMTRWSADALYDADDTAMATVHPDAVETGYWFTEVTLAHGYRGPYQRITVSRAPLPAAD